MLKELNTDDALEQSQWLAAFWKGELKSFPRRPRGVLVFFVLKIV